MAAVHSPERSVVSRDPAAGFRTRYGRTARPRYRAASGRDGPWALTLPDGRQLTVDLIPVPVIACDHRFESHAYQPNDTLRHLVQIRDGQCAFPTCSRHATESDFEHATSYDKSGKTCAKRRRQKQALPQNQAIQFAINPKQE
jgi:hypothetical protein